MQLLESLRNPHGIHRTQYKLVQGSKGSNLKDDACKHTCFIRCTYPIKCFSIFVTKLRSLPGLLNSPIDSFSHPLLQPAMDETQDVAEALRDILSSLKTLQQGQTQLAGVVNWINTKVNLLGSNKQTDYAPTGQATATPVSHVNNGSNLEKGSLSAEQQPNGLRNTSDVTARRSSIASKIILTSYPGQAGIDPLPMRWGHKDALQRGPVVVARNQSTIRRRNGLSTHYPLNPRRTSCRKLTAA